MDRPTLMRLAAAVLLACAALPAFGQRVTENRLDLLKRSSSSTATITPIFSQLFVFSLPKEFEAAGKTVTDERYLQQSVPVGQTLENWKEMITVTGEKDAASRPELGARQLAVGMANLLKNVCPTSFSDASFGPVKLDRYDGFATVISCGMVTVGTPRSETLLLVAIKGEKDLYTLQWTERGPASATPLTIDPRRWQDRLSRIAPVRLCSFVEGEAPPYPSCR